MEAHRKSRVRKRRQASIYPDDRYVQILGGWSSPMLSQAVSLFAALIEAEPDPWLYLNDDEKCIFLDLCQETVLTDARTFLPLGKRLAAICETRAAVGNRYGRLAEKLLNISDLGCWKMYFERHTKHNLEDA